MTTRYFRLLVWVLLFQSFPHYSSAQANEFGDYVSELAFRNNIRAGLRMKDFGVRFFDGSGDRYSFRNAGLNVFIGCRYKKVGGSISLPITTFGPLTNTAARRLGLNLQFFQARYYIQLRIHQVRGFEQEGQSVEVFRPDMLFTGAGIYSFWVQNPRLSLRAAFRNKQRQLRTQGSWILAGTSHLQSLHADSISLSTVNNSTVSFTRFRQFKIGIGAGYAFSWVFSPSWYITPVLVVGPEFRIQYYQEINQDKSFDHVRLSPRVRGRLAFGYNGDRFFTSLVGYWLPGYDLGSDFNTRVNDLQIALTFGRRF